MDVNLSNINIGLKTQKSMGSTPLKPTVQSSSIIRAKSPGFKLQPEQKIE
jgi:hypothetical protein